MGCNTSIKVLPAPLTKNAPVYLNESWENVFQCRGNGKDTDVVDEVRLLKVLHVRSASCPRSATVKIWDNTVGNIPKEDSSTAELSRQVRVDVERTFLEESKDATNTNLADFRNELGRILEAHRKEFPLAVYVQGQHCIVSFFLHRGARAHALFTRIIKTLKLGVVFLDGFPGMQILANSIEIYFSTAKKRGILQGLKRNGLSVFIVLSRWIPTLYLSAGLCTSSAEMVYSLILTSRSSAQAGKVLLLIGIYLLECSNADDPNSSTSSIFQFLNKEGKSIDFGRVASIAENLSSSAVLSRFCDDWNQAVDLPLAPAREQ